MGGLLTFFAGPAKLKALLIGAMAMIAVCLALTVWALLERSGRLDCKVELVTAQAQIAVLSDAVTRQNKGIDDTAAAGKAAQDGVAALLKAAKALAAAGSALGNTIDHARGVLAKPPGKRPDGKDVDCSDAWREIESRVKP